MILYYLILFVLALGIELILLSMKVPIVLNVVITFFIISSFNFIIAIIRSIMLKNLLEEACDPEAYLKRLEKQERRMKRNQRVVTFRSINKAAVYLIMGDTNAAKTLLEEVNQTYLSDRNGTRLVYTINIILCYYLLGDMERAETLFETNITKLPAASQKLRRSVEILVGERYYFLGKYDECYNFLKNLLDDKLTRRQYLGIIYRLAEIELMRGETEKAKKHFRKVERLGNKLKIVQLSREKLEGL